MNQEVSLVRASASTERILGCPFALPVIALTRKASSIVRGLLLGLTLIATAATAPDLAAQKVQLSVDPSKTGAKIHRNIFGQFAEHLGHGVYKGI